MKQVEERNTNLNLELDNGMLKDILDAAKVLECADDDGSAPADGLALGLGETSTSSIGSGTTTGALSVKDVQNDDFEFVKPVGFVNERKRSKSISSKDTQSVDDRIAEAVKEAFQAGFAAASAAAVSNAAAVVVSNTNANANATAIANANEIQAPQNFLSIVTNSSNNINNPIHTNTDFLSLHSAAYSQVPSPWLHGFDTSALATPLSAFGITSLHGTPSGTPIGTPHTLAHTPWESPFMGSPFLSPYEDPMGELDAFGNIDSSGNAGKQQVGDITSWWAENTVGVVDPKSFNELLVDTGYGIDLGTDADNDPLMMPASSAENRAHYISMTDVNDSTAISSTATLLEIPKESKAKKQKTLSSTITTTKTKRTTTKKKTIQEDGMPSGAFWKVIKNGDKQTLFQCPFPDCSKTFTRPYNLKSHYRSHTGERPFVCNFDGCSFKFSRKYDLKRHEKIHSGVKSVQCPDCSKTFIRTDYLRRHQKVQEGKSESECEIMRKLKKKRGGGEEEEEEEEGEMEGEVEDIEEDEGDGGQEEEMEGKDQDADAAIAAVLEAGF